ncbi:MAG: NurA domain-containing protein [Sporanaerobacter sp.]|jgi:DNA-directed RNA polymerase subunit RPC12/RpoP|uniref:hypothetical protein n=1 Tax=Sporanaerobacter sp. TaxID=2010183 RepID=UPI003A1035AF
MGYSNIYSNKPFERASKTAHTEIINDETVKKFIENCWIPASESDEKDIDLIRTTIDISDNNNIRNIVAVDGGYRNEIIKNEFPSATMAFFQFGVLFFKHKDLIDLKQKPFIDPDDMAKLQEIQRFKLVIPTKGMTYCGEANLTNSVRLAIYEFFMNSIEENGLMKALKWLIFSEYESERDEWFLSSCPCCSPENNGGVKIRRRELDNKYTIKCPRCGQKIYLTDVFRLHEAIDDELGAGGILGYVTTAFEQLLIVYLIKTILEIKPEILKETIFIKDGPLAYFGQTARIHQPMRELINYLNAKYTINLIGLEKSGSFVEHAASISDRLEERDAMILNNRYIYKYIIPGDINSNDPYASTSYYGAKVIYKSQYENIYVATIPTKEALVSPKLSDLINAEIVLNTVADLKCDLYYNSLIPVVLANKLVSLADHPSSDILKTFAKEKLT